MPLDTDHLNDLITKGEASKVLALILADKESIPTPLYQEASILSSDLSENTRAKRTSTLSEDVLRLQRNQINQSLLLLIRELEKPSLSPIVNAGEPITKEKKAQPKGLPTEILQTQSQVERLVETIAYVITQLIRRPLKYKFINLVVLLLAIPLILKRALKALDISPDWLQSIYSNNYFWIAIGVLFIMAVALAVRDILKRPVGRSGISYALGSPIKGLRSFDFGDATVFKQLQRHDDVDTCLQGILQKEYRFGILTGESGCGKTSFLRAGLASALMEHQTACVVAKLRNEAPLVSIQEALKEQLNVSIEPADAKSLKDLLIFYMEGARVPGLTLIMDQFEQFFTQQKTLESRRPFIDHLNECYQELPTIRLLVSLRKDFQGYLFEVQDVLGYSLTTRQNYFDLRKFSPIQATEIFRVMAEAEGLEFDASFVFEMCKDELASKEDGLISAVDIQILAFIIKGQQLEEKAFTRSAFLKMGGVEGLLQRYLEEQFNAPNRYNQDQAGLKVLLAFIDLENNVRIGELTLEKLLPRIDQAINNLDLQAILNWLEQDLRLLTKTEDKDQAIRYELAHERLINPLRNLAGKTLSQMDQANIILERRTNEWIANDRKRRFLLSWGEYRNIIRHKKLLVWGKKQKQKQELLKASRGKFQLSGGLLMLLLVLAALGWGGKQNNDTIHQLFTDADDHILALQYDSAMVKLWDAGQRFWGGKQAGQRMTEVAFYYNEISQIGRAQGILDTMAKVSGNARLAVLAKQSAADATGAQDSIRHALQQAYPVFYDSVLMKRYFPEMITVKGGSFLLGCRTNDCDTSNANVVQVSLSDYKIARTETTVWQYELFTKATSLEQSKEEEWDWIGNTPAINVSWFDAIAYANWLSERMKVKSVYQLDSIPDDPNDLYRDTSLVWTEIPAWEASGYRLPTEAEWEYAARGGSRLDTFLYSGSDIIDSVAWNTNNSAEDYRTNRTHPVQTKRGNSLGLYDMSGNVFEWCWDWYARGYDSGALNNPKGPDLGRSRVLRGGSWFNSVNSCAVSYRSNIFSYDVPFYRNNDLGFRLTQGL